MQNKYQGKYLLCDVDGTLMTEEGNISEGNIAAIREFCAKGGKFGLATGRAISTSRRIASLVGVNAPCILFNGAVVYDFETNTPMFVDTLPQNTDLILKKILLNFPLYRATVATLKQNIEVGAKVEMPFHTTYTPIYGNIDDIKEDWIKIVFHLPPEERLDFIKWLEDQNYSDVSITSSSVNFVEILPFNCTKGKALPHAAKAADIAFENLYVIGDYYNDKDMLQKAVNSACPSQAPDDIKEVCDIVVNHVDDDAVADYISRI